MAYLTGRNDEDLSVEESRRRFKAYQQYLESIRPALPVSAHEFASASWHYDPRDPKCPHDAWVESINIIEPAKGERHEIRGIEIHMRLLGAYHDGHIEIRYLNVSRYATDVAQSSICGHGDWLVDEIGLTPAGAVMHTIDFVNGTVHIECGDICYQWIPLEEQAPPPFKECGQVE